MLALAPGPWERDPGWYLIYSSARLHKVWSLSQASGTVCETSAALILPWNRFHLMYHYTAAGDCFNETDTRISRYWKGLNCCPLDFLLCSPNRCKVLGNTWRRQKVMKSIKNLWSQNVNFFFFQNWKGFLRSFMFTCGTLHITCWILSGQFVNFRYQKSANQWKFRTWLLSSQYLLIHLLTGFFLKKILSAPKVQMQNKIPGLNLDILVWCQLLKPYTNKTVFPKEIHRLNSASFAMGRVPTIMGNDHFSPSTSTDVERSSYPFTVLCQPVKLGVLEF